VPNGFSALVNWIENGVAPAQILNQAGTRPLCPYPQTAIYNGSGPTNVATNQGYWRAPERLLTQAGRRR